jgi:hypothetical protein
MVGMWRNIRDFEDGRGCTSLEQKWRVRMAMGCGK